MSEQRKQLVIGLIVILFFLVSFSALASINVTNRTGTIKIILPDGVELVVESDEALPDIPDGSTIEILSGSADVECTDGSYVNLVVGTSTAYLGDGDAVSASYDPDILEGNIVLIRGRRILVSYPGGRTVLSARNPRFNTTVGEIETEVEVEQDSGDISPSS